MTFCLSNRLVQVFFKDNTELFIDQSQKQITYLNNNADPTILIMTNNEAK